MRIYTRAGDQGRTHMIDGQVDKSDLRVEACGTIDELNAFIGETMVRLEDKHLKADLNQIQYQLFDLGGDLAQLKKETYLVKVEMVKQVETWIDKYDQACPPLDRFILPGGTMAASALHICRVVCRRAERRVVALGQQKDVNPEIFRYLNRLSDLFFVLARLVNDQANVSEIKYNGTD